MPGYMYNLDDIFKEFSAELIIAILWYEKVVNTFEAAINGSREIFD